MAQNYFTALEEAGRSPNTIRQAKIVLAAMFTMAIGEGYLDANPFHDQKTPKVSGPRAIKVATTDQYVKVRAGLPTRAAKVFSTLMVSSGIRFCEAIALRPLDLHVDTSVLEVGRSVVKVSRKHHPQGKTFLVREYTKNGGWRAVKLDRDVAELVRIYAVENGIGRSDLLFPIELIVPPRAVKEGLSPEEIDALGFTEPVRGRSYRHGTMSGYVTAKCRCDGCRQWAREYGRAQTPGIRRTRFGKPLGKVA